MIPVVHSLRNVILDEAEALFFSRMEKTQKCQSPKEIIKGKKKKKKRKGERLIQGKLNLILKRGAF